MAARRSQVEIEWDPDEEVWVTYVPGLGHLSTYGDTREEALAQTREAVLGYLEAASKDAGGIFSTRCVEQGTSRHTFAVATTTFAE